MKRFIFLLSALVVMLPAFAVTPNKIVIPNIEGYKTLKGDFHVHTSFSDGGVWPTTRIDEALWEGLDVIAISDHLDSRLLMQRRAGYFSDKCDRDESYRIAAKAAGDKVLVVHAGEISRGMPPGHFNCLFVKDNDDICAATEKNDHDHVLAMEGGLKEARKQGAFLMWNHPHWHKHAPNETIMWPVHKKLLKEGYMDAIEVYNMSCGYSPEAHEWCLKYNLAILGNSDCHQLLFNGVDYLHGEHRPITLLFAEEKSLEGVRDALNNRRSALFADGVVYGREQELAPLFKACVKIKGVKMTDKILTFTIENKSSIPVVLTKGAGSEGLYFPRAIEVPPFSSRSFKARPVQINNVSQPFKGDTVTVNFLVETFQIGANKPLPFSVKASKK